MNAPDRTQLAQLWLEKHFSGISCVVFFELSKRSEMISIAKDKFGIARDSQLSAMINADVYIVPVDNATAVVNSFNIAEWGFVMSWNGERFTSHNS